MQHRFTTTNKQFIFIYHKQQKQNECKIMKLELGPISWRLAESQQASMLAAYDKFMNNWKNILQQPHSS